MNCHQIQKMLAAYQDEELEPRLRELVSRHLRDCPSCQSVFKQMEKTWQVLEAIPEIDVPPQFYQNLSRKIRMVPDRQPSGWRGWFQQLFAVPAVTAVLLVVGLSLGVIMGNYIAGDGQAPLAGHAGDSEVQASIDHFKVFASVPPGSLGDGYLRMASAMGDDKK